MPEHPTPHPPARPQTPASRAERIAQGRAVAAAFIARYARRTTTQPAQSIEAWANANGYTLKPADALTPVLERLHLSMRPSINTRAAVGKANGAQRRYEEALAHNAPIKAKYRAAIASGEIPTLTITEELQIGRGTSLQDRAFLRVQRRRARRAAKDAA